MDFSKFDQQVDLAQLKNDINDVQNNAPEYKEVTKGIYLCGLENLELGETKDHRPMLKAMFRIKGDEDGNKCEFTKNCLFMNRVLYGTKNDANMIASAVGWLKTLEPSSEVGDIVFEGYAQFADLVMDIAEDVTGQLEYVVNYDPDTFNSISIDGVFEIG
jgi:hypothetical protein